MVVTIALLFGAWAESGRVPCHRRASKGILLTQNSKTQDVLEFVYEYYKGSGVSVFWINAGSSLEFYLSYRELARQLLLPGHNDPKEDPRRILKSWLDGTESGEWVLVLDSADNLVEFFPDSENTGNCQTEKCKSNGLAEFIPQGPDGTVIITTRDRELADRLTDYSLAKNAMAQDAASQLFQKYCPAAHCAQGHDESVLQLLKELQCLPIAIVQAASYLNHYTHFSPAEYLKQVGDTRTAVRDHLLSKPFNFHGRRANVETVATIFSITLQQIQEQSPLASSLLKTMACVDHRCIPHELLARGGFGDEIALGEALSKLINLSLLTFWGVGHDRTYDMHPLVQLSVQSSLSLHDMATTVERTTKVLVEILSSGGDVKDWPVWKMYIPHAFSLAGKVEEESESALTLYLLMFSYLLAYNKEESQRTYARAKALLFRQENSAIFFESTIRGLKGKQGRWDETEELWVKFSETSKRVLGQEHLYTLTGMGILARTYWRQGRWKEAEDLQVKVLETRKRAPGQQHLSTLVSMADLASTYWGQGRWKEAEELEVKILETRKRVLGQEHLGTLASMANLASTYKNQGRWKEAEELEVKVLETRKRVLGQEHLGTMVGMADLASTYRGQGRWKEAEELEVKVLETRKRVLDQKHLDTLASMANLASTYRNQGRWKEAEELQVKVLKTRKRVLGQEHLYTLASMADLASTYRDQGRWKEAEELQVKVLEARKRVLGQEHLGTLASMADLASTYRDQGRLEEAEGLEVKVLETRKRVLGQEHLCTLSGMETLAWTYWRQGRWKEAEELQVRVLETRKRVLGQEHLDTLGSMASLAETYWKQGRWLGSFAMMAKTVWLVKVRPIARRSGRIESVVVSKC